MEQFMLLVSCICCSIHKIFATIYINLSITFSFTLIPATCVGVWYIYQNCVNKCNYVYVQISHTVNLEKQISHIMCTKSNTFSLKSLFKYAFSSLSLKFSLKNRCRNIYNDVKWLLDSSREIYMQRETKFNHFKSTKNHFLFHRHLLYSKPT